MTVNAGFSPTARRTLIAGGSSGMPGCTTPTDSTALRFFGNQRIAGDAIRSRTGRDERDTIASGAVASPAVQYRRRTDCNITDPTGNATHVIVSGPAPAGACGQLRSPAAGLPHVQQQAGAGVVDDVEVARETLGAASERVGHAGDAMRVQVLRFAAARVRVRLHATGRARAGPWRTQRSQRPQ